MARKWTFEELETLKNNPTKTAQEVARLLPGRSTNNVQSQAKFRGWPLVDGRKVKHQKDKVVETKQHKAVNAAVTAYESTGKVVKRCMWHKCGIPTNSIYCPEHMSASGMIRRQALIAQ